MIDQQQGNAIPLTVTAITESEMPPKDNPTMIVCNDSHSAPLLSPPDVVMPLEDLCVMPPPLPPLPSLETPYHNDDESAASINHHKPESPRKRPRKSVSFSPPKTHNSSSSSSSDDDDDGSSSTYFDVATEVYEIPRYDDYTREEYEAMYLTQVDYKRIRKDNLTTLKLMMKDIYPSTSKYYFRGLETHIPKTKNERLRKTKSAVNAILKQQKILSSSQQHGKGSVIIPSHWIDTFYVDKYSSSSAEDAYMVALFDHTTLSLEEEEEIDENGDVMLGYSDVEESDTSSSSESIDDNYSSSDSESVTDDDFENEYEVVSA